MGKQGFVFGEFFAVHNRLTEQEFGLFTGLRLESLAYLLELSRRFSFCAIMRRTWPSQRVMWGKPGFASRQL